MVKIDEKKVVQAQLKYFRVSPKKVRPLLKSLKGKKANKVLSYLKFDNSRASVYLLKLFNSALINAKNKGLEEEKLVVLEFSCDEGPVLKRFRAGHRGMLLPYQRKLAHLKVVLGEKEIEKNNEKQATKIKRDKVVSVHSRRSLPRRQAGLSLNAKVDSHPAGRLLAKRKS